MKVIYPCQECNERHSCAFFLEDADECVYDAQLRHEQRRSVLAKLNSFRELNYPNWNDYGANPISSTAITSLETIIPRLKYETPLDVFPIPNGGIQLEFEDNNNYLELEYFVYHYNFNPENILPENILVDIMAYEQHKENGKEYYVASNVPYNDMATIVDKINDAVKNFESKKV